MDKVKGLGQTFTPRYFVEGMLNIIGYNGKDILCKHIMDNSCGDGAFLCRIVERYCHVGLCNGLPIGIISADLETYIHGIEIDEELCAKCKKKLDEVARCYGIGGIRWDILNRSSLSVHDYDGKMDYVIGNPPYVRVHNMDVIYNEVKGYRFAQGGMTDLYLVFYEIGFNMLNEHGKLCYITPNSWLSSVAGKEMRKYIVNEGNLVSLIDMGHYQVFDGVNTYSLIGLFCKDNKSNEFEYHKFDNITLKSSLIDNLSFDDCYVDDCFYLSDKEHLQDLKEIKSNPLKKFVSVKNGFATLADKIFIGDNVPESDMTIKVLKASTGKWYNCIFPYDKEGKLLSREIVFGNKEIGEYFESHKKELLKGREEYDTYYEFGRTQAINDVWKDKLSINCLLRTGDDLKIVPVKKGKGIYSGLYIICNKDVPFAGIEDILRDNGFIEYVRLLKKYKSDGYYTFSSKDVEQYINYYLTYKLPTV
jgi:adenine-specific DNA-methyltransferase